MCFLLGKDDFFKPAYLGPFASSKDSDPTAKDLFGDMGPDPRNNGPEING